MGKRNEPSKTQLAVLEAMKPDKEIVYIPKVNRYKLEGYGTVPFLTVVGLSSRAWIKCISDGENGEKCTLTTHGRVILAAFSTQPRTQSSK